MSVKYAAMATTLHASIARLLTLKSSRAGTWTMGGAQTDSAVTHPAHVMLAHVALQLRCTLTSARNISTNTGGVRGGCTIKGFTFFEGETCDQSCMTRSLGAYCTKATPSSAPNCTTGKTYLECVGDHYSPDTTFLGFTYNKTCDEVDCAHYGACCSLEKTFKATSHGHALLDAVALTPAVTTNGLTLCKGTPALVRPKVVIHMLELAASRVEPAACVSTKSAASPAATDLAT
jgi:hypothetical protein